MMAPGKKRARLKPSTRTPLQPWAALTCDRVLRTFRGLCALLLCLTVLAPPAHATAADAATEVIWVRTDFPPYFIVRGDMAGQGVSDRVIDYIASQRPDFRHRHVEMTLNRFLELARWGTPVCHAAMMRNRPREDFLYFTKPLIDSPANHLIVGLPGLNKLGQTPEQQAPIDLFSLEGRADMQLSLMAERSYGPEIDQAVELSRHWLGSPFLVNTGLADTQRRLQLVLMGRLDGIILRPEEATYFYLSLPQEMPIFMLPIARAHSHNQLHIACAQGDWSADLLNWINRPESGVTTAYRTYLREWLPNDDARLSVPPDIPEPTYDDH